MADVTLYGHIEGIRYKEKSIFVTVSEYRCGFVRRDGERVPEELLTFVVVFLASSRKYISSYFKVGSLVKVRGSLLPYVRKRDGTLVEGCTISGQLIELATYPKRSALVEKSAVRDSEEHPCGVPSVDSYLEDDF